MRLVWPPALLSVVLLGGCIPIPPHHAPFSRGNVPEEIPGWLEPGHSTLADALFQLGEPDDYSPDRRTLGWVNINRLGGGVLLFAAGGSAAAVGALGERSRRLVVQFDGNGVVTDRWLERDACFRAFGALEIGPRNSGAIARLRFLIRFLTPTRDCRYISPGLRNSAAGARG